MRGFFCRDVAGVTDKMSLLILRVRNMCVCCEEGKGLWAESRTLTSPRIESPTYVQTVLLKKISIV